jgi:hypothetical protein
MLMAWGCGGLHPEEDEKYRDKWKLLGFGETELSE